MRSIHRFTGFVSVLALAAAAGCAPTAPDRQSEDIGGVRIDVEEGSAEALAILALVNDPAVDVVLLDDDVGLDKRAAENIVAHRNGVDGVVSTADDNPFDTVAELDGVPYVGESALQKLLTYAQTHGYGPGGETLTEEQMDRATLALVNDPDVGIPLLDDDVGLDKRAATNIVTHRDGPDGVSGTGDDDRFDSIDELDAVPYVGPTALALLRDYAISHGYVEDELPPQPLEGRPDLSSPVQYENTYCTYGDTVPYVRSVAWDHPDVQAAMSALVNGYRSTFSYTEWRVAYGLESDGSGSAQAQAFAKARNFVRVLCGEHRDYPDMLAEKLAVVARHTKTAGPGELTSVDTDKNLFDQLTYPAYTRLVNVMRTMHTARSVAGAYDGYHYGYGAFGHGSRRVDNAVPPFTQCEMKFVFERYLVAGSPTTIVPSQYEAELASYRATTCTAEDLSYMFNFRGHVNFQPLWLESNGFIHNSRRARGAELSTGATDAYQRPFATRYDQARKAWATYLFHNDTHHQQLIAASEWGGGPILYLTDQDQDGDGLADYRLFSKPGCGDTGVGLLVPSQNCNMVDWTTAWNTPSTRGHTAKWDPAWATQPDMGFMTAFTTFQERMSRFNQALDRHTNWGPTGYYMLDASTPGDTSPRFFGAYSPIVAASYDVSASDFFVRRDYPSTDAFEQGRAKWLFVMRFPVSSYYDAKDLAAGKPMRFDEHYFNETSLSNDYYDERALDHWGYIETQEAYAQVYLTYGHRGETAPSPVTVPAP